MLGWCDAARHKVISIVSISRMPRSALFLFYLNNLATIKILHLLIKDVMFFNRCMADAPHNLIINGFFKKVFVIDKVKFFIRTCQ